MPATDSNLDATVDPRFGRCRYLLIVETDSLAFKAVANLNTSKVGGAGVASAQIVVAQRVEKVLTGDCGPNAYRILSAAGIGVIAGCSGRVRDVIARFKNEGCSSIAEPTVFSFHGTADGATHAASGVEDAIPRERNSPDRQDPLSEFNVARGMVARVDKEICSGCVACVDVCPRGAIRMNGAVAEVNEPDCMGCGICLRECPFGAISLGPRYP